MPRPRHLATVEAAIAEQQWIAAIERHKIECHWIGSGWRCYVEGTQLTHGSTLKLAVEMMVRALEKPAVKSA